MNGDLTINFWEMRGIPVYRMIARWIHIMRNPHYGFMTDTEWRQANYKGKLMYVICTPDLEVVRHRKLYMLYYYVFSNLKKAEVI